MAYDLARLEQALINADKAGDTDAAKAFANEIRRMRAQSPTPPSVSANAIDPTEGNSFLQNAAAGLGKFFVDTGRGISQMSSGMGLGGAGLDNAGLPSDQAAKTFYETENKRKQALQTTIDEEKRLSEPLMKTWGGNVGNIAPAVATGFIPGANTIKGATLIGSILGMLKPTTTGESRLGNAAENAAWSGGATAGFNALGRMLRPQTGEAVKKLMAEGVTPTPGQIMGEGGMLGQFAKKLEEGATSIPILGSAVRGAQTRGLSQFNVAAVNRALRPIGESFDTAKSIPGHDLVTKARGVIEGAYDDLVPKLKLTIDDPFRNVLDTVKKEADILPEQQAKQLNKMLEHIVEKNLKSGAAVRGEPVKLADIELRQWAEKFSGKNESVNDQMLGALLHKVRTGFKQMIGRQNPQYSGKLDNIDKAYANLIRVEQAAGGIGAREGVFTPAQLLASSRAKDVSLGKRSFAQGSALMQGLGESGKRVLAQTLPESGTAPRLFSQSFLTQGMGLGTSPLALAYTKLGQAALVAALTKRPEMIKNLTPKQLALIQQLKAGAAQGVAARMSE